ncbi:ribonuclease H-like domain-containing protein [Tanacetum coccineum]
MELENSQNNALAKLPMLKLEEYEMWEIMIKQYFQIQDYALWEVIENGNSWVPIPVTSPSETGTSTGTKMIVSSTAEEKTCKKNDVKARSPNCSWAITQFSTATTKVNTASTEISTASFSDATVYAFLSTQPKGSQLVHEDLEATSLYDLEEMDFEVEYGTTNHEGKKVECFNCHRMGHFAKECRAPRDGVGFDWSNMVEEEIQQQGSHRHSQIPESVGHKEYQMGLLMDELEKVKQDKEGFEFKIAKFDKSAKDLEQLLASQITHKSKKGFGYNAVPSPHHLILNRPTPLDLSYSGLEEFKRT